MKEEQPIVQFKHVNKTYPNGKQALFDINLSIMPGEFVCFIGTSGCGKTTTLRMINRMLTPSDGQVIVDGQDVMKTNPIELRRHIGYVIQNIGLIPHMTLEKNITLVPRLLKWPRDKQHERAKELMKLIELPESYLNRYPYELSGGQQQRIGVVRALAADQKVILMDEPFGALDPITREKLQTLVKKLQREMGKTIIMITHDMNEAMSLANRLIVMDQGRIIQNDTPSNIVVNPANDFVKGLLGEERLAEAQAALATAETVMLDDPTVIGPEAQLFTAFATMKERHVDSLLVVDQDRQLVGEVDVAQLMEHEEADHLLVKDIMTKNPRSVMIDDRLSLITRPILQRNIKYMPVTDYHNRLVGIITRTALTNVIYEQIWGRSAASHHLQSQVADGDQFTVKAGDS